MEDKEKDLDNLENTLSESEKELLSDADIFGNDALSFAADEKKDDVLENEAPNEIVEESVENKIDENTEEIATETIDNLSDLSVNKKDEDIEIETSSLNSKIEETPEVQVQETISNQPVIEEEVIEDYNSSNELVTVRPIKFQEFDNIQVRESMKRNLDILQDISMHVSVELGKAKSTIKEVMDIKKGSIIELNKIAGEQVEIYINDKYVAKGEVIVIEDKFGIRVTNTSIQKK